MTSFLGDRIVIGRAPYREEELFKEAGTKKHAPDVRAPYVRELYPVLP